MKLPPFLFENYELTPPFAVNGSAFKTSSILHIQRIKRALPAIARRHN